MEAGSERCPECGSTVPRDEGYLPWCECGWHIVSPASIVELGTITRITRSIGRRRGDALFNSAKDDPDIRPGFAPSLVLVWIFSAGVYLSVIALIFFGTLLAQMWFPNPFFLIAGAALWLLAIALRPRFDKPEGADAPRDSHASLHKLVAEVSSALDVLEPERIVISSDFNASVGHFGWRQQRILTLGLPLFANLGAREKVALVAHEMAHFANGDPARGIFVHYALTTLAHWCEFLVPPHRDADFLTYEPGAAERLAQYVNWALSLVPRLILRILLALTFEQSQRAEYYADVQGARVSGTSAFVGTLEKLLAGDRLDLVAQSAALGDSSANLVDMLREDMASVPPREVERLRRAAEADRSSIDATHPPTSFRIRLLESRLPEAGLVSLSDLDDDRLQEELGPHKEWVHKQNVDRHVAMMHDI